MKEDSSPSFFLRVAINRPLNRLFDYRPYPRSTPHDYCVGGRIEVPFGRNKHKKEVGIVVGIVSESDIPPEKLKASFGPIDNKARISATVLKLCQWAAKYYHHPIGEVLSLALPPSKYAQAPLEPEQTSTWRLTRRGEHSPISKSATRQLQAIDTLKQHSKPLTEATLKGLGIQNVTLKALQEKGLIEHITLHSSEWFEASASPISPLRANEEQQAAVDCINSNPSFQAVLLYGVTGSGKTEVYLQAIAHTLTRKQPALVLIPEINLTPQTLERFRQRFQVRVEAYHSGLTDLERKNIWLAVENNQVGIVIATRSGIFLPFQSLGLIVVDEEHDASFKQNDGFSYNGRDLAVVRAKLEDCPVVLGSGTPSCETWLNANIGRYQRLSLTQRAGGAIAPDITIQDIRSQTLTHGLSHRTLEAIAQTLSQGNQVLIFKNRRGFAPVVQCHDCAWVAECHYCDTPLTFHNAQQAMICHHCNYRTRVPVTCGDCASTDLRPLGQGTERIYEGVQEYFPQYPVIRVDRDTTAKKNAFSEQLATIKQGKPLVMIGTQMLAKGHHFPKVTLAVILGADSGLASPDFRAGERLAQLVVQVAGRSGRENDRGRVILQTHHPEHPLLQALAYHGYDTTIESILAERQAAHMRPFTHIAILRGQSRNPEAVQTIFTPLRQAVSAQTHCWGPVPAPMAKVAGAYRYQMLFRSQSRSALSSDLEKALDLIRNHPLHRQLKWSIDVDPYDLF